jgi:V8-like Glu-specific endopeptidase
MASDVEDVSSGLQPVAADKSTQTISKSAPSSAPPSYRAAQPTTTPTESGLSVSEVSGDPVIAVSDSTRPHDERSNAEVSESGEEFAEATPAQLYSAESGEESALSDLTSIEGFEAPAAGQESLTEGQGPLLDAGEAQQQIPAPAEEFLPILAALAPTLISTIGPAVAKGVMSRLSPRVKKVISRIPSPVVAGATTAIKGIIKGQSGKGNLLSMISSLLREAAAKPAGESGAEANAALVEEAAAVLEVIIGTDDRVRIEKTTELPWRRLCALRITFPTGATYRGTGFLIGPRAVATAGHCVYLHTQGGWARKIEVIPAANGALKPYNQVEATMFKSVTGWVAGRKPESDYGCVVLPPGAFGGRNLGSFGFAAFDTQVILAQPAVLAGYPGDKPFAELWGMARRIKSVSTMTLVYDIDTMGGQSGAPVYIKRNGQRYVVGIHNYGVGSGNSATRVTREVYDRLLAWSKL